MYYQTDQTSEGAEHHPICESSEVEFFILSIVTPQPIPQKTSQILLNPHLQDYANFRVYFIYTAHFFILKNKKKVHTLPSSVFQNDKIIISGDLNSMDENRFSRVLFYIAFSGIFCITMHATKTCS